MDLPTEAEPVKVVEGDCFDVLRAMPEGAIDCTITDPPYGVRLGLTNKNAVGGRHGLVRQPYLSGEDTYEEFLAVVPPAVRRCLELSSRAAVFSGPHLWEQPKADAIGGVYMPNAAGRNAWGFKNLLPVLLYGKAPDLHRGVKEPTVLRSTVSAKPNGHPCPKPVEWMRWLVRLCTRPGELVLDPFGGSGTTAVACIAEGRRCLLIEKEPAYAAIARKRVAEAMGAGSLFAGATP